ncbi:hypothetical protein NQ314_015116 [Rhamnusium bicolor]|uniref:2-oxo-4-hydroxy-4-carboxy-5-ureidoimidazoline decarboxylase n=1 Tax=Rhamnusium bicolor TaxID=1586634 RepID=A0AAV8WZT0_9CUCU|nr:hypothetical protein NQ314_015116 [Rhamnusium bicolor]
MLLTHPLTIQEVNNSLSENFIRIFGNVVEHCPAAAIGILKKRPFSDVNHIIKAVIDFLDSLKISEKEKILQLYPDLLNKLTYLSSLQLEMEITGKDHLSVEEKRKLRELNSRYKNKFGFPFIVGSKEECIFTIVSEIVSRLQNDKDRELRIAMEEVKNIVKLRIHEIVR